MNGRELLASGSSDRTVRVWDPVTGEQVTTLQGHQAAVWSVCPVTVNGRDLLASGSSGRTVRVWDLATAAPLITIPVHYGVLAVRGVGPVLAIGLAAGLLVIKLSPDT
jgi:WD40 repeat protein